MAITEEARHRLYLALEAQIGTKEATTLMEHLPPVGWGDVATRSDVDRLGVTTSGQIERLAIATNAQMERLTVSTGEQMERLTVSTRDHIERLTVSTGEQIERLTVSTGEQIERLTVSTGDQFRAVRDEITALASTTRNDLEQLELRLDLRVQAIVHREINAMTRTFVGWMLTSNGVMAAIILGGLKLY